MIELFSEEIDLVYENPSELKKWLELVIKSESYEIGELTLIFTSDDNLLKINKQYLNHDYYTDVITFDYVQDKTVSGDIFISIDRIKENANTFKVSFLDELNRIIVHGLLHLLGYPDKEPAQKKLMTEKEDFYLKLLKNNEK